MPGCACMCCLCCRSSQVDDGRSTLAAGTQKDSMVLPMREPYRRPALRTRGLIWQRLRTRGLSEDRMLVDASTRTDRKRADDDRHATAGPAAHEVGREPRRGLLPLLAGRAAGPGTSFRPGPCRPYFRLSSQRREGSATSLQRRLPTVGIVCAQCGRRRVGSQSRAGGRRAEDHYACRKSRRGLGPCGR